MDKEFHYYITYLIATRAGFEPDEAGLIAKVCQATDENTKIYEVMAAGQVIYSNYVSQTANLLRPRFSRMRIYPVFHFIPGDPDFAGAKRADGRSHPLNTTPDSALANKCFDDALATKDLYKIGIACHAYADTWAHQNFVGYKHRFNNFEGFLEWIIPSIGHADAKHAPDWSAHIWSDTRLVPENRQINNKERFLDAAVKIFDKLANYSNLSNIGRETDALRRDLNIAIGEESWNSRNRGKRIRVERYRVIAGLPEYGYTEIPEFELKDWFDHCLERDPWNKVLHWRDAQNHENCQWYLFQEAIKQYQRHVLDLYGQTAYVKGISTNCSDIQMCRAAQEMACIIFLR